jgi:hypothetical protein
LPVQPQDPALQRPAPKKVSASRIIRAGNLQSASTFSDRPRAVN